MYEKIIRRGVDFLYTHGNVSEKDREVYSYGLELILMYILNAGAILLLGIIAGRFLETLLLLAGFALMQSFGGGYHAMTHLRCFLLMLFGWGGAMLLISLLKAHHFLPCIFAVLGLITVLLVAPVKHKNYPMSKEKEQKMKRIARCIALVFFVIVLICDVFFPETAILASIFGVVLFLSGVSMVCATIKQASEK